MRYSAVPALLCVITLVGCDRAHGPRLAMRKDDSSRDATAKLDDVQPPPHVSKGATTKVPPDFHYQGRTVEQWALALSDPEHETIRKAAEALQVIGPAGRPYLFQGLEHPNAETRRLCLDNLTASDLRVYGDRGHGVLIKLCGDPEDFRIRQRSSLILAHWQDSIPARP